MDVSKIKKDEIADLNKKKRSKKKTKLTDTDIMNNFMKSLHSHPEEDQLKKTAQNQKKQKADQTIPKSVVGEELKKQSYRQQQVKLKPKADPN